MSYNYTGLYISVYPVLNDENKTRPPPLTGVSPSGGNDHITLMYFGKTMARKMKNRNIHHISEANNAFMNKFATVNRVMLNELENAKHSEVVDGEVVVTMKSRYDVLYCLDEKTSYKLDEFSRSVMKSFSRNHPRHISHSYHWDREEAEQALNEAKKNVPFRVRMGATYDD